ncbi:MAG: sporulation protein YqfD, partial [Eubacteriales bacterium]
MGSFSNFMRGNVACTITAPFPERVLNLCALSHLMFWGLEWHSPTSISIHLSAKEVKRLAPIVDQLGGNISAQRGHGLPFFLLKFRHRLGFLVGLSLSVFAVAVLSNFILVIDVEGNEQISTADILSALERAGLSVGVYGPHLSLTQLQQEAMTYLDGVSWLSVNRNGTRAEVTVRESTIPPEIQSRDGVFDILSDVDGIIQSIELHRGEPLVVVGETVTKGQPLVSGYTE